MTNHDNGSARHEPVVCCSGVPIPYFFAGRLRKRLLHRGERIVDQHHVGAAPKDSAADANRVVNAARSRMPFTLCVTVGSEPSLEQRSVFRTTDQVANVTT